MSIIEGHTRNDQLPTVRLTAPAEVLLGVLVDLDTTDWAPARPATQDTPPRPASTSTVRRWTELVHTVRRWWRWAAAGAVAGAAALAVIAVTPVLARLSSPLRMIVLATVLFEMVAIWFVAHGQYDHTGSAHRGRRGRRPRTDGAPVPGGSGRPAIAGPRRLATTAPVTVEVIGVRTAGSQR